MSESHGLPEYLDDWTIKDKLRKGFSVLLTLITFLLIGGGFAVIGYLGFKVYKNPSTAVSDISRNFVAASPSQSSISASSSANQQTTTLGYVDAGMIKNDAQTVLKDPQYQGTIDLLSKAPKETSLSDTYNDYKQAFSSLSSIYSTTKDQEVKFVLIEIKTYVKGLPNYKDSDMALPT